MNFDIIIYKKESIDSNFKEKNKKIMESTRGGGYWLWKPYIINETLKTINDNDILFYLDSKYYFIEDFDELYSDYMKNNDVLVWKNKPNEPIWYMKQFCKMDVILKYDMYDKIFNESAPDCWGGAIMVKKTNNTVKFINEWLDMCCVYEDITDSVSKNPESKEFKEHRHDQSMLSILLYKYDIPMQHFETRYLQNVRAPY